MLLHYCVDAAQDFAKAGHTWTAELCKMDSDGDGVSNGQELGDPKCTVRGWQAGCVSHELVLCSPDSVPAVSLLCTSWQQKFKCLQCCSATAKPCNRKPRKHANDEEQAEWLVGFRLGLSLLLQHTTQFVFADRQCFCSDSAVSLCMCMSLHLQWKKGMARASSSGPITHPGNRNSKP